MDARHWIHLQGEGRGVIFLNFYYGLTINDKNVTNYKGSDTLTLLYNWCYRLQVLKIKKLIFNGDANFDVCNVHSAFSFLY